jgi:DUF4097 and DUF4098 domain-containing protein YvlB
MILTFAAAAAMAFSPRTDTTFAVTSAETRLVIENFAGDVSVGTWSKNSIRIEADHSSRTEVEIERDESTISVKAENRHGVPASVDFRITVPPTVAIEISGTYADVTVEGTRADVSVETVRGDVNVTGGAGHIALQSVEGDVTLEKGRGRAELQSVNAGVKVVGLEGELVAETVNGEVSLEDIRGNTVEASTVNGDVLYDGVLREGGSYRFATHNGDITVSVPAQTSANVSVTTYSGEFDSDFPIKVTSSHRNRRMRFTLGSGAAELELESFQGAIHLQKKGDGVVPADKTKDKTKSKDKNKDENPNPEGKE